MYDTISEIQQVNSAGLTVYMHLVSDTVPVKEHPVKVQLFSIEIQFWSESITANFEHHGLWVLSNTAHNGIFIMVRYHWVRPNTQFLKGHECYNHSTCLQWPVSSSFVIKFEKLKTIISDFSSIITIMW